VLQKHRAKAEAARLKPQILKPQRLKLQWLKLLQGWLQIFILYHTS
jgi:hypothetical protein